MAEAARVAGVKTVNERLMGELRERREQTRALQSSLEAMSLELKTLRVQLAGLQRQVGSPAAAAAPQGADDAMVARTRAVYQERITKLERDRDALAEQLASVRDELARTQREKSFIEEHYLGLAEA